MNRKKKKAVKLTESRPSRRRDECSSMQGTIVAPSSKIHVHVPVIHGIGVRDAERWKRNSVDYIRDHLQQDVNSRWVSVPCVECLVGNPHEHLANIDSGAQLLVESVVWGDRVVSPSRRQTARRLGAVVPLVILIYLGSGIYRRFRRHQSLLPPRPQGWLAQSQRTPLALLDAASFLLLSVVLPPLGLFSIPMLQLTLLLSGGFRSKCEHALAWTMDEAAHDSIRESIRPSLGASGYTGRVVVAHSQGASICAEMAMQREFPEGARLVTLGSGHGILALLRQARKEKVGIWGLFFFVAIYSFLVALSMLPAFALVVALGVTLSRVLVYLGAILWATESPLVGLLAAEEGVRLVARALVESLRMPVFTPVMFAAASVGWIGALLLVKPIRKAADLYLAALNASNIEAEGVDIMASHDPVSAALTNRDDRRVREIRQVGSLTMDHVTYFKNRSEVLDEIARQIYMECAAGSGLVAGQEFEFATDRRREFRSLRVQRVLLAGGCALFFMSPFLLLGRPLHLVGSAAALGWVAGYIGGCARLLSDNSRRRDPACAAGPQSPVFGCVHRAAFAVLILFSFALVGAAPAVELNARIALPDAALSPTSLYIAPMASAFGLASLFLLTVQMATGGKKSALASSLVSGGGALVWVARDINLWPLAGLHLGAALLCWAASVRDLGGGARGGPARDTQVAGMDVLLGNDTDTSPTDPV